MLEQDWCRKGFACYFSWLPCGSAMRLWECPVVFYPCHIPRAQGPMTTSQPHPYQVVAFLQLSKPGPQMLQSSCLHHCSSSLCFPMPLSPGLSPVTFWWGSPSDKITTAPGLLPTWMCPLSLISSGCQSLRMAYPACILGAASSGPATADQLGPVQTSKLLWHPLARW